MRNLVTVEIIRKDEMESSIQAAADEFKLKAGRSCELRKDAS